MGNFLFLNIMAMLYLIGLITIMCYNEIYVCRIKEESCNGYTRDNYIVVNKYIEKNDCFGVECYDAIVTYEYKDFKCNITYSEKMEKLPAIISINKIKIGDNKILYRKNEKCKINYPYRFEHYPYSVLWIFIYLIVWPFLICFYSITSRS